MIDYAFYILLGFLPSLIWLLFYLRKDTHPEPKGQIIQIFIWGMLIAPLAVILELFLAWLIKPTADLQGLLISLNQPSDGWRVLIGLVFFAPLVEEYLKYRIVRVKIIKDSDFDEPLDAMLYLIIGALGFAAVENLIIVLRSPLVPIDQALGTIAFRFIGATFLHALASGTAGYFLARSFYETKKRFPLVIQGLTLAIIFHASYNYLITLADFYHPVVIPIILLLALMALYVSYGFRKLKKQLSVCEI